MVNLNSFIIGCFVIIIYCLYEKFYLFLLLYILILCFTESHMRLEIQSLHSVKDEIKAEIQMLRAEIGHYKASKENRLDQNKKTKRLDDELSVSIASCLLIFFP